MVSTAAETRVRDFAWLKRHIPDDARAIATDVGSGCAVISIMGPDSRALLQGLTTADLSNEAFPFAHSREIELGHAIVRASRITYVGELGWELYVPTEFALGVYEALLEAGDAYGLTHAGMHALNSLRMEKAYRHWGHDVTDEDTPLEAGLMFAVRPGKAGGFIGRDALLRQVDAGTDKRLVQFRLEDPTPMVYHNEPILRGDEIVGLVRSGMYGHTLGGAVALAYVEFGGARDDDALLGGDYAIEVAGERHRAAISLTPMYDPKGERVRGTGTADTLRRAG